MAHLLKKTVQHDFFVSFYLKRNDVSKLIKHIAACSSTYLSTKNKTSYLTSLLCDGSWADASSFFSVANLRVASANFSE